MSSEELVLQQEITQYSVLPLPQHHLQESQHRGTDCAQLYLVTLQIPHYILQV